MLGLDFVSWQSYTKEFNKMLMGKWLFFFRKKKNLF